MDAFKPRQTKIGPAIDVEEFLQGLSNIDHRLLLDLLHSNIEKISKIIIIRKLFDLDLIAAKHVYDTFEMLP
jgi:hypothetical protein